MVSGLGVPVIFPSSGSLTRHSLPSTGSAGACSPASPVQRSAPTPDRPSRRASFPSRNGTVRALDVRSWGRRARHPRAWAVQPGVPPGSLARRRSGLPGSWGAPHVCMPRSSTPASSSRPASCGVSIRPSVFLTTSALAGIISRGSITRPAHSLCTLRSADHSATTQHSVPAGGQPLPGGTGYPLGLHRKVSEIALTSLPPFPGFAWRTRNHNRGKLSERPDSDSGLLPRRVAVVCRRAADRLSVRIVAVATLPIFRSDLHQLRRELDPRRT